MSKENIVKKSISSLVAFCVATILAGCSNYAERDKSQLIEYDLGFGSDEPIHATELLLANGKHTLHSSGGGYSGGSTWEPDNPQSLPKAGGFHVLAGKQFIPRTAHARWFSYQNQNSMRPTSHSYQPLPHCLKIINLHLAKIQASQLLFLVSAPADK